MIQAGNVLAGLSQLAIAALAISGAAELWHLVILSAVNGCVASVSLPRSPARSPSWYPATSWALRDLREGWTYFRSVT